MAMPYKANTKVDDLFEKRVLHALANVKDGSITVIKQDNLIIQVNISESLNWAPPAMAQPEGRRLGSLV